MVWSYDGTKKFGGVVASIIRINNRTTHRKPYVKPKIVETGTMSETAKDKWNLCYNIRSVEQIMRDHYRL